MAERKLAAAFEFLGKLGHRFFCFHDRDLRPRGRPWPRATPTSSSLGRIVPAPPWRADRHPAVVGHRQPVSGPPARSMAAPGRRHNPIIHECSPTRRPEQGLTRRRWRPPTGWAASTTCCGAGREGYETLLLNTDMKRERSDQLGRFMALVVEHKHRLLGFRRHHPESSRSPQEPAPSTSTISMPPPSVCRLPPEICLREGDQAQHRGQPCHPATGSPLLRARAWLTTATPQACWASVDINRGDPPERLGY